MNSEIKVSICCLVYNHESFLKQCLDGLVNQKTDFEYEILIHDDASTDSSANIIRAYEKKYPELVKPIYQTENQYSKHIGINKTYQYPRAKGKYLAFCEGDDYWCDEYKLQKQFDALENNEKCYMCVHKVQLISEDGSFINKSYPKAIMHKGIVEKKFIIENLNQYLFQTSSYFVRKDILEEQMEITEEFNSLCPTGDVRLISIMALVTNFFYLEDTMSCYRVLSSGSWSQNQSKNNIAKINNSKQILEYALEYNKVLDDNYCFQPVIDNYWVRYNSLIGNYKELIKLSNRKRIIKHTNKKERLYFLLKAILSFDIKFLERKK